MKRREFLAAGTAAVGLAGCDTFKNAFGIGEEDAATSPSTPKTTNPEVNAENVDATIDTLGQEMLNEELGRLALLPDSADDVRFGETKRRAAQELEEAMKRATDTIKRDANTKEMATDLAAFVTRQVETGDLDDAKEAPQPTDTLRALIGVQFVEECRNALKYVDASQKQTELLDQIASRVTAIRRDRPSESVSGPTNRVSVAIRRIASLDPFAKVDRDKFGIEKAELATFDADAAQLFLEQHSAIDWKVILKMEVLAAIFGESSTIEEDQRITAYDKVIEAVNAIDLGDPKTETIDEVAQKMGAAVDQIEAIRATEESFQAFIEDNITN